MTALAIKETSDRTGWQVVVESNGEVILSTHWGLLRRADKPWDVFVPWPGFRKDLKVADREESLRLAQRIHALLVARLSGHLGGTP